MLSIPFTKMHGLGNDYVYVDCFRHTLNGHDLPALARVMSDRHRGIGSDGLILIAPPSPGVDADVRMEMYNADGSRGKMCGNGIRCVAKYAVEHGMLRSAAQANQAQGSQSQDSNVKSQSLPLESELNRSLGFLREPMGLREITDVDLKIETDRGVLALIAFAADGIVHCVRVDMGPPILRPKDIPVNLAADRCIRAPLPVGSGAMTCVSMGNPHAVTFVDRVENINLNDLGPKVERHAIFPDRVNFHVVAVQSRREATMRTWERGSGITQACGTGACAVLVAGVLEGRLDRRATIHLPGGDLLIEWDGDSDGGTVYKTGPAEEVFCGVWKASE